LEIINDNNTVNFKTWNEILSRKTNHILTPIPDELLCYNLGGYSCTCNIYLETYSCQHSLAISMVTNRLSEELSSSIPIGTKKGPGRPLKAVKGAYNSQPIDKNTKKSELICMFLAITIIFLISSSDNYAHFHQALNRIVPPH
jgi:hypothetical protein